MGKEEESGDPEKTLPRTSLSTTNFLSVFFSFLWQTERNMIQVPKEIFNHTERERKLQNGMGLLCDAVTCVHPELCLKLEEKCQLI